MEFERRLAGKRVIITCGPGGVGKTTLAAAIGLELARRGERVAVLTIDPARRLATSLHLAEESASEPTPVPLPDEANAAPTGSLHALMLDPKSTFDRLVERYATSQEQYEKIINNKFYRTFSGAVGGTQEFIAMERLYELLEEGRWDRIVLDTPPTVHALDFLDAPQRLIHVVDRSVFRWLAKPYLLTGKASIQVLSFGSAYIFKTLTTFIGGRMLQDLSEYVNNFKGMFDGFKQRAEAVESLLHAPDTLFLIVSSWQPNSLIEARKFYRDLARKRMPFGAFVINRVLDPPRPPLELERLTQSLETEEFENVEYPEDLPEKLLKEYDNWNRLAARQRSNLQAFFAEFPFKPPAILAPILDRDIADVPTLLVFASRLFGR